MDWISPLGLAIALFASTNLDDLFLVMAYFTDPQLRRRDIVLGQLLGIGLLVAASALAALGALLIPEGWTALLGVVPLGIGLQRWRASHQRESDDPLDAERSLASHRRAQWLAITFVTIANGGDNLGVYVPLFASGPDRIPFYAGVFAVMTGLWCALAHWLVNHRSIGAAVRRIGRRLLPFVLIGLGIYILLGARALL